MSDHPLAPELRRFEALRLDLIDKGHTGKWACIVGEKLVGTFDDPLNAFNAGVAEAGTERPFLVQQILAKPLPPQVSTFSMGVVGVRA